MSKPSARQTVAAWPIVGNAAIGHQLTQLWERQQLPSALAFFGPAHVGKSTAAQWLVQYTRCEDGQERPCQTCVSCRQIEQRQHPDVLWLDTERISIDHIRDARERHQLVARNNQPRWIVLIDAERMSEAAANGLLKFVEELPKLTYLLVTSSHPEDLVATLRSRLTTMYWHFASTAELGQRETSHAVVARAAGRPGWLTTLQDREVLQAENDRTTQSILAIQREGFAWVNAKTDEERQQQLDTNELVLRELLLSQLGVATRRLWPNRQWPQSNVPRLSRLLEVYIERYEFSPTIQSRLVYDNLNMA